MAEHEGYALFTNKSEVVLAGSARPTWLCACRAGFLTIYLFNYLGIREWGVGVGGDAPTIKKTGDGHGFTDDCRAKRLFTLQKQNGNLIKTHFHAKAQRKDGQYHLDENQISKNIVDCCYRIHLNLGPGLLESVYLEILRYELKKLGLNG